MIMSPYLSKIVSENPDKEITMKFLNRDDDLFIGFFDEKNENSLTKPLTGILFTKRGEYYEGPFVNGQKEGQGK